MKKNMILAALRGIFAFLIAALMASALGSKPALAAPAANAPVFVYWGGEQEVNSKLAELFVAGNRYTGMTDDQLRAYYYAHNVKFTQVDSSTLGSGLGFVSGGIMSAPIRSAIVPALFAAGMIGALMVITSSDYARKMGVAVMQIPAHTPVWVPVFTSANVVLTYSAARAKEIIALWGNSLQPSYTNPSLLLVAVMAAERIVGQVKRAGWSATFSINRDSGGCTANVKLNIYLQNFDFSHRSSPCDGLFSMMEAMTQAARSVQGQTTPSAIEAYGWLTWAAGLVAVQVLKEVFSR